MNTITSSHQETIDRMQARTKELSEIVEKLKNIADRSPALRAEAETIRQALVEMKQHLQTGPESLVAGVIEGRDLHLGKIDDLAIEIARSEDRVEVIERAVQQLRDTETQLKGRRETIEGLISLDRTELTKVAAEQYLIQLDLTGPAGAILWSLQKAFNLPVKIRLAGLGMNEQMSGEKMQKAGEEVLEAAGFGDLVSNAQA